MRAIRDWWTGEYIPPKNDPGDTVIFVVGRYRRPAIARATDFVWRMWMKHWLMVTTVGGLVIAIIGLRRG